MLLACASGKEASFEISVAAPVMLGQCAVEPPTYGGRPVCARIRLCAPQADLSCEPIEIAPMGDAHGAGDLEETLLYPLQGGSRDISIDVRDGSRGAVRIEMELFDEGGVRLAEGSLTTDQVVDEGRVAMRLFPVNAWSCAGSLGTQAPPPRGLHASLRLDNGHVLVLGGVAGEQIPIDSPTMGPPLQRDVVVYEPGPDRFARVTVANDSGDAQEGEGFGRAFFSAFVVGEESGEYRIRVIGGVRAPDERAAVLFDALHASSAYGTPILPSPDMSIAPSVDLLYEPRAKVLRIVPLAPSPTAAPMAGVALSDGLAPCGRALVPGFAAIDAARRLMLDRRYVWIPSGAACATPGPGMLGAARLGATATGVDAREDVVLVWGGNVDEMATGDEATESANRAMHAGEILWRMGTTFVGSDELPLPTVFHTATRIRSAPGATPAERVLIAGGYVVGLPSRGGLRTELNLASPSLSVLRIERMLPLGFSVSAEPVSTGSHAATALHSATVIAESTDGTLVLLAGGAAGALGESLNGLAAAGVVRDRGPGMAGYEAIAGMGIARWGHAATLLGRAEDLLPYRRVLVTGGLVRRESAPTLRSVEAAEILALDVSPTRASERVFCDMPEPDDAATPPPPPTDGAIPPPPPLDAGPLPSDSGPRPSDGGMAGGG
ncbi:MAG: hypothetical protein IT379_11365 [Deltaproteobacteria bacterium]|nr:hypothetical protein [Deltaproteobacteria bacterium]